MKVALIDADLLDELAETGKRFQFRQGLDVRLMTRKKAERLAASRYFGDFIFAFDHVDEPTGKATMRGLQVWREHCQKSTKVYVLSGFDSQDEHDIFSVFKRIRLLMSVQCVPYITRFERYVESPYRSVYVQLARWCNQTALFKKKSFAEFLEMAGNEGALRGCRPFMERFPVFCDEFFNLKYEEQ